MAQHDNVSEIYTENTDAILHKMTKIKNRISLFQSHILRLQKELDPYEKQYSSIRGIMNGKGLREKNIRSEMSKNCD